MSDIFRVKSRKTFAASGSEKLWKGLCGIYAICALMLLFAGIAGWQIWQRHELAERAKVSEAFIAAQRISNPQAAAGAFVDLSRTAPKGYSLVARLSQAGAMFASGQQAGAIDIYKQIAKDDSGPIGSMARLRAAWALADNASRAELAELLKPLDQPGNAWRLSAREILAYADYRAMDTKSALSKYSELAQDPASSEGLRARARAMATFLRNGGAVNYGSVPPDAVPQPDSAKTADAGAKPATPAK